MNKAIYIVIASVCGAAIGGGLAYVYLNKKYDVVFEKETESYRKEIGELRECCSSLQKRTARKLYKTKEEMMSEEHMVAPDPDSLIIDSDDDEDNNVDIEPTNKSGDIRFISIKDFEDDDDFEKETIEYYMGNGVIVQDDDVLEDEEFIEVCGDSVLPLLRKDKSLSRWSNAGDNEIYVRNEEYGTDYKIKRHHMSYDG